MNILFYLDPSIEFNNPTFRYTSYRNSILPQAKALAEGHHKVSIVTNSSIKKKAIEEGLVIKGIDIIEIDTIKAIEIGNFSEIDLLIKEKKKEDIKRIIKNATSSKIEPDIVIVWESKCDYLEELFPRAQFIYETPGFFSRPPFPQLISLNRGILDKAQDPDAFPEDALTNFENLRKDLKEFFYKTSKVNKLISKIKTKFKKVILFPLQIDGYFMVDSQTGGMSQLELILQYLEIIPEEIALLVTDYKSKDISSNVLNEQNLKLIRSEHKNFIYSDEINAEFCVSQQILPFIDGVITISSSVGLQAAFWELPIYCIGNNYVSKFNSVKNINELISKLGKVINQDSKIARSINYQNIPLPGKYIENDLWANNFLKYLDSSKTIDSDAEQWISENLRKKEYLRAIGFDSSQLKNRTNCPELLAQIKKHNVISFDIFDTLLMRPFISPSDLFKFIEPLIQKELQDYTFDFVKKRRESEKIAFNSAIERGEGETTINEIYDVLCSQNNIDQKISEKLIEIEVEAEKSVLYRRESIYNAYLYALSLNKKIIIASDMYLPESVIKEVLSKNNITYDRLYLSSTIKKKKSSGELFNFIINELECRPEELLHIGDNVKGDLKVPKSKGIHCFHMPRTIERMLTDESGFYKNVWKRDERNHSISAKSILSILGNYYYDNAYLPLRKNTLFNGDAYNLGFMGFGPLLFGYAKWLCEEGIRNSVREFYFLARDGKIMKEAYDIVSKFYDGAPSSRYMLCSRRSVNLCKIKDFSGINDLLHVEFASNIRLDYIIQNRFGVNPSLIEDSVFDKFNLQRDKRVSNSDVENLIPFFKEIEQLILDEAKYERDGYLKYLKKINFIKERSGEIAIVDIGYAGTMQQSLNEICEVNSSGYYLITFRKALERLRNNNLESYAYLGSFIDRHDTCEPFCRYVPLFETLFSSIDTSFVKFYDNGNQIEPIFLEENPNEELRRDLVNRIHIGAIQFIKIVSNSFSNYMNLLDIEPFKSERMLLNYFSNPDGRDARILKGVVFEDSYGGKKEKVILPLDISYVGDVVWRNGLVALKKIDSPAKPNVDLPKKGKTLNSTQEFILKVYKNILNEQKYQKLENRPEQFFNDSKNFITKNIVSRIYLK